MRARYLVSMLAIAVLHLVATSIFAIIAGRPDLVFIAVPVNLVFFVAVNLAGAALLFRPIQRYLAGETSLARATPRIHRLALLSAAWAMGLIVVVMSVAFFAFNPMCPACSIATVTPYYLSMMGLFASFIGIFMFFLVNDYAALLRIRIFEHTGEVIEPTGARLRGKAVAAFIAVGVIPMSLAMAEIFLFPEVRRQQGITTAEAFLFDAIIIAMMAGAAFFFIQRNFARPVEQLDAAMKRVAAGHLDSKAPTLTDDEMGALAVGFNRMLDAMRERDFIKETFGRYVPEAVADAILQNRGQFTPQLRLATILYADIEAFTTICERLDPPGVVALLNEYFSMVIAVIDRHGGVVNQFQGDALLVTFNVPVEREDHAAAAVRTAMEIQRALASRVFSTGDRIRTRIGINTGSVVAGPVGADERLNYTVHGDAVNIAARLENLNKQFGTRILVSEAAMQAAGAVFAYRAIGEMSIRGKAEAVTVYTVDYIQPEEETTPWRSISAV